MILLDQRRTRYVIWQNRATRFYVASRLCYMNDFYAPAAYCGFIALELILKATLVYHDNSFKPAHFLHNFAKLSRALRNKVPNGRTIQIPSYFSYQGRYLSVTRYPANGKGIIVPGSFLADLDLTFATLIKLTSFQHNTELKRILAQRRGPGWAAVTRSNLQVRGLRTFLRVVRRPVVRTADA